MIKSEVLKVEKLKNTHAHFCKGKTDEEILLFVKFIEEVRERITGEMADGQSYVREVLMKNQKSL